MNKHLLINNFTQHIFVSIWFLLLHPNQKLKTDSNENKQSYFKIVSVSRTTTVPFSPDNGFSRMLFERGHHYFHMGKQPYIPFYVGDYLKDTRVLPLNVRGGYVDLILYMWDASIRGEIIGSYEDFSRLMSCSMEDSVLVIQTLNQKNVIDFTQLDNGQMKIESRKIKKMEELSKTRKIAGMRGGNPNLVNQTVKQDRNQKVNLNAENEIEIVSGYTVSEEIVLTKPWSDVDKEFQHDYRHMKDADFYKKYPGGKHPNEK